MLNKSILPFFLLIILFAGCDENRIFEQNIKFSERFWTIDETVVFDFNIDNINQNYNFYFNLRNSLLYPYQNIYLSYSLEDTLGNVYSTDLANIDLFNRKTGKPLGDGLGDIFDHQYKVIDNYEFNNPGVYRFKIKQYMRMDTLPEIMSVGLKIDKSVNNN